MTLCAPKFEFGTLSPEDEATVFNLTQRVLFADWVIGYAQVILKDEQFKFVKDNFEKQWHILSGKITMRIIFPLKLDILESTRCQKC